MISQLSINDYNSSTSFITISETSSQKIRWVDPDLLETLSDRGYFKANSDVWQQRIQNCGLNSYPAIATYSCGCSVDFDVGCGHFRLCPRCNERYKYLMTRKIGYVVSRMKHIRSLTLSPSNYSREEFLSGEADKEVSKIWRYIQNYIRNQTNYNIGTFVAVKEYKFNPSGSPRYDRGNKSKILGYYKTDNWNIHLHILYDGDYIPQKIFSQVMKKATKGKSRYVYIKSLSSRSQEYGYIKSIKYICKYIGKFEVPGDNLIAQSDFFIATKGKRLVNFSHDFDKVGFYKFKMMCPVCKEGHLLDVFFLRHDDDNNQPAPFQVEVDYEGTLAKLEGTRIKKEQIIQDRTHVLLKKIDKYLIEDGPNIDKIHSVLTESEISYLLSRGDIYQPRYDRYEAIA